MLTLLACEPTVALDDSVPDDCPTAICMTHKLADYTVGPYEESENVCMSWTIGNEEALPVNTITAFNDGAFHHSNWFWVPESEWDLPDGAWDCHEHEFTELGAALAGGVIFAQSTQVARETQQFLPGAVTEIGPRARIVAWTHLLNPTAETVDTSMTVQLGILDEAEVTTRLAPMRLTYFDLDIPPGTETSHGARCDIDRSFEANTGRPVDLKMHYALSHFHGLGTGFRLGIVGGPRDGEDILVQRDAYGHALGETFAEPVDLTGATGIEFSCDHRNGTDAKVGWGIGDQEMCVMLGFMDSDVQFDIQVAQTTETGELDGVQTRTGPCTILGLPYVPPSESR